jgi:rod shape-determining protein MreC
VRGRFKLVFLFGSFLIISLTAFNSTWQEQISVSSFFSCLAYPIIFINHKIKNFCQQQNWSLNDHELQKKNLELQNLVTNLLSQNVALLAQSAYWQEHQELIEFSRRYHFDKMILSQVFFKKINLQEHYMLLDKGLRDGVELNMVAIYKNHILGKVVAVYPHYCQLDLVTSTNCKIAVYDVKTGAMGICCGCNNSQEIAVNYVSHLQKIACDDLLISSGDGQTFPAGFGVGQIVTVAENGMYHQATAKLMFDLEAIKSCYLIASNKS